MNVHILKSLKEEPAWVIDKWLRVISSKILFSYTTKKLKNKAILNLNNNLLYALLCDP